MTVAAATAKEPWRNHQWYCEADSRSSNPRTASLVVERLNEEVS